MSWVTRLLGGHDPMGEESLGEYLKKEREQKKISLRELAQKTRVREHLLRAIEEDRHDLLPSPIYVKGFLSAYAKHIGQAPHEILLRYERFLNKEPIICSELKTEKRVLENRILVWIVGGAIAISLGAFYFVYPYFSSPSMESPSVKPEVTKLLPIIPNTQISGDSPPIEKKSFSLELKAVEETWIRVQVNGQPPEETLFKPGEGNSYQSMNRIELVIGNAGGLDMIFGGKKLEKFGKSGEVVTLIFSPQGVERKRMAIQGQNQ